MATTLTRSGVADLDLSGGSDGIKITNWVNNAEVDGERVVETLQLKLDTAIHTAMGYVNEYKRLAAHYRSGIDQIPIWLEDSRAGEGSVRRSAVYSLNGRSSGGWHSTPSLTNEWLPYTLQIERHPFWERESSSTIQVTSNVSVDGGTIALNADLGGDASGRIEKMQVYSNSSTPNINEAWIGFRTDRFGGGSPTYTQPVWELDNGTAISGDTTITASTGAVVSFSTETEADRFYIRMTDALLSTEMLAQAGEYQVLMRASIESSTIAYVRLKDGYYGTGGTGYASKLRSHALTKIDSSESYGTNNYIHNLGTIQIPPMRAQAGGAYYANYGFVIAAQRTSGSGDLTMNKIYLVPREEGFVHFKNAVVNGLDEHVEILTNPDDEVEGLQMSGGIATYSVVPDPNNFGLPVMIGSGAPYVTVVAQRATQHDTSDTLWITSICYPRYRELSS